MTSLSNSINSYVCQTTKTVLLASVKIEKRLPNQLLLGEVLNLKIWHGSHFCLEILVFRLCLHWKMEHFLVFRHHMRDYLNLNFCTLGESFITIPKMTVYSYSVTYAFQSESTLYGCLNVKTGAMSEV